MTVTFGCASELAICSDYFVSIAIFRMHILVIQYNFFKAEIKFNKYLRYKCNIDYI